jgi:hypothetical protein
MEMRGAVLAKGLSPEEWISLRTRQYLFFIVLITIGLLASICLLVLIQLRGRVDIDIAITQLETAVRATTGALLPSEALAASPSRDTASDREKDDRVWRISYSPQQAGDRTEVVPTLPYLDFQKLLKPAPGLISAGREGTFTWKFPELPVTVVNNTSSDVVLTKAHFVISNLKRDLRPILVAGSADSYGKLRIANEGWSPARHAVLTNETVSLDLIHELLKPSEFLNLGGFGRIGIPRNSEIAKVVSDIEANADKEFHGFPAACVSGKVNYLIRMTLPKNTISSR